MAVSARFESHPLVPLSILRIKGVAVADVTQMVAVGGFFPMFVNGLDAASLNSLDESRFCFGVIARYQHRGCYRAHLPCAECACEGGVERFDHLRGRQRSRQFRSGGAFGWRKQRVEGLEICRTGDVDDGLPANSSAYSARMSFKAA